MLEAKGGDASMFRAGARAEWNTANRGSGVAEHKEAVLCSGLQDIAVP